MMTRREMLGMTSVAIIAIATAGVFAMGRPEQEGSSGEPDPGNAFPVRKTDAQWRAMLSPASYDVLRHEGTEAPFTSPLLKEHRDGIFSCAGCDNRLFESRTKYDSHTGWPSFWDVREKAIVKREDRSIGMARTEVRCATCGGHLGHVFDDGPKPTGLRYCMNGVAMTFQPSKA